VPTGWIALPEDLLKVSIDKFSNSLSRSHIRVILRRGVSLSDASEMLNGLRSYFIPLRRRISSAAGAAALSPTRR